MINLGNLNIEVQINLTNFLNNDKLRKFKYCVVWVNLTNFLNNDKLRKFKYCVVWINSTNFWIMINLGNLNIV